MYFLYNLVVFTVFIFVLPGVFIKGIFNSGFRYSLKEKLVFFSPAKRKKLSRQPNIWLHAVSVGEIYASIPLIKLIKQKFTNYHLIVSTTTITGQIAAREKISEAVFIYFPWDLSRLVAKAITFIKPVVFITAESEFWPNFFRAAHKRHIPIILFNGRISPLSFNRYQKTGALFRKVLNYASLFGMQSELDKERLISLGVDSSKINVTGNTKFDALKKLEPAEIEKLKNELKISSNELVFVAGSTHPGEEEVVLNCFSKLKREFSGLRLILCPRHLKRLSQIEGKIKNIGLSFIRRSYLKLDETVDAPGVIILDTMGELAGVYSLASVAFVGGSLVPKGGQNILEPINFGKPTFFGPYMNNFQGIAELMEKEGIGFFVKSEDELYEKTAFFLRNGNLRAQIANKAKLVLERNGGASRRNFELITDSLLNL